MGRRGERGCGAGPATMTSRADAEIVRSKIQKGGGVGRAKSDLGGTCHNDKPGLEDGEAGVRVRGEEACWKAGPATMTSRAVYMRN